MAFPPFAKVAPIASTEAVLDDPTSPLEQTLKKHYGDTHVVEMEGYGAVLSSQRERTPSMVVRGVSDMTQQKTDDDDEVFQPLAASHAAAFAFELLSHFGLLYDAPHEGPAKFVAAETIGGTGRQDGRAHRSIGTLHDALDADPFPEIQSGALAFEAQQQLLSNETAAAAIQVSFVLNLSADFGPDDQARVDLVQEALRRIAGSQKIDLVAARKGSLLVFVADPDHALSRLSRVRLREGLLEQAGVDLIGFVPLAVYEVRDDQVADLRAASSELLAWPATLPDGEQLVRPELTRLSEQIDRTTSSTTAVIGAAGAGKSALLSTLSRAYSVRGWPVLAIKADLLDPDISHETDLRDRLGLTHPPATLLRDLARLGPVLLVIDQLDALAGYLDVKTARLSILLNLVRKLGGTENVHIVLSSRPFEFPHRRTWWSA